MVETTFDDLISAASSADVVLFGEVHDDDAGHVVESELYAHLCARGVRGQCSLSLEMLERGIEGELGRFVAGEADVADVIGWGNFADYAKMLHIARASGSPIIPANPPRPAVSFVYREGAEALADLSAEATALLPPLPLAPASPASREKLAEIFAQVSPAGEDEPPEVYGRRVDRLVAAQNLWDAGQAYAVGEARRAEPELGVFHVCGIKHVEGRLGVPEHLQRLDPDLNVLIVIAAPCDGQAAPAEQQGADFVVVTPAAVGTEVPPSACTRMQ